VCEPYAYLKNVIYEKRLQIFDCELLTEELLGLERNASNGKIDHPDGGKYGSKDIADAVCGSIFNASSHAEEFAFEYGELLDNTLAVNYEEDAQEERKQIVLNFEDELKKVVSGNKLSDTYQSLDFGMGKAQPISDIYTLDGIVVPW